MTNKHKWKNEIIAFVSGEEVECSPDQYKMDPRWFKVTDLSDFGGGSWEFRIKPKVEYRKKPEKKTPGQKLYEFAQRYGQESCLNWKELGKVLPEVQKMWVDRAKEIFES